MPQNNVEITLDFITSIGFKNQVTAAAEARARTGHDIFALPTWDVTIHREVAGAGRRPRSRS